MNTSKKLTIFEGPDGSGKTTVAKDFAAMTGARYVHFGPLTRVDKNLGRMYVEAMLPALLGYQDVVFDRCWLSEVPYGTAFRGGRDRLGDASRRILERLAMRCGAVVVLCRPSLGQVLANFRNRQAQEYLEREEQLRSVYEFYDTQPMGLNFMEYNYTTEPLRLELIEHLRPPVHPLDIRSAGNWAAETVLVGEKFAEPKDNDAFYQWPFGSFNQVGCSQWLTGQLISANVPEHKLLWVNADQDLSMLYELQQPIQVIALGQVAAEALDRLKINATVVPHPQHHKRFYDDQPYELLDHLR